MKEKKEENKEKLPQCVKASGISIFKVGAQMDVLILVRDLDRAVPPIPVDQDLDVTYDRLYCGNTTLQDSDLNINQYPVTF